MANNHTARLENWGYDRHWRCFYGNVFNDTKGRFQDGDLIFTSSCDFQDASDGKVIKTLNSTYFLGKKKEEQ